MKLTSVTVISAGQLFMLIELQKMIKISSSWHQQQLYYISKHSPFQNYAQINAVSQAHPSGDIRH